MKSSTISYLRKGRKRRCTGVLVTTDHATGLQKVKPMRDGWKHVYVTPAEVEAGKEKPDYKPRPKEDNPKPKKEAVPEKPKQDNQSQFSGVWVSIEDHRELQERYQSLVSTHENLKTQVFLTIEENLHLADGTKCTLQRLKKAMGYP